MKKMEERDKIIRETGRSLRRAGLETLQTWDPEQLRGSE